MYAIIIIDGEVMKVEKLDHYGNGIIKDKKIGFIRGALPEEDIEYKVIKSKKNYFYGEVEKYNTLSSKRIKPKCRYSDSCGGCQIDHMNYNYQLEFKCRKVEEILKKFSNIDIKLDITYDKNSYNYRNKIVLHVINNKLGLLKEDTNDLVEIDNCLLVDNRINDVIKVLKTIGLSKVKTITIKVGNITNEVMLIVDGIIDIDILKDKVDVLIVDNKVLTEKDYIISIIGNKKYKVSKDSFFQVNKYLTKDLYNYIKEEIEKSNSKKVLDLYCGTGTIGIFISDKVEEVLGIEVVKSAVKDAKFNKELNNCNNIDFRLGKVEDIINDINDSFDTVIIDPPRKGLHKKVVEYIINNKFKNIIYVSCDPVTMSRDIKQISELYKVRNVKLFDMFPNTYHCESIAVLERNKYE